MGGDREDSWHAALVIKAGTRGEILREESVVTREKTATGIKKQEGNKSSGEAQNRRKIRAFPH